MAWRERMGKDTKLHNKCETVFKHDNALETLAEAGIVAAAPSPWKPLKTAIVMRSVRDIREGSMRQKYIAL